LVKAFPFNKEKYLNWPTNLAKPIGEIFEFVLAESNLNTHETLFIDDTEINIDTADPVRIVSLLINNSSTIEKPILKWLE